MGTIHYIICQTLLFVYPRIQSILYWDFARFVAFNIAYLKNFV
jgi:hypothetical protein